jgi:hypothetical protein
LSEVAEPALGEEIDLDVVDGDAGDRGDDHGGGVRLRGQQVSVWLVTLRLTDLARATFLFTLLGAVR